MLLMGIRWYKDQQLTNDNEGDVDEYLDAFVALGGDADKEGFISKDVLVEIIKTEFELTIDMQVSETNQYKSKRTRLLIPPLDKCVCVDLPCGNRW